MFHVHFHGCKIRSLFCGEMREDGGWGGKVPREMKLCFMSRKGHGRDQRSFFLLTFVGGF